MRATNFNLVYGRNVNSICMIQKIYKRLLLVSFYLSLYFSLFPYSLLSLFALSFPVSPSHSLAHYLCLNNLDSSLFKWGTWKAIYFQSTTPSGLLTFPYTYIRIKINHALPSRFHSSSHPQRNPPCMLLVSTCLHTNFPIECENRENRALYHNGVYHLHTYLTDKFKTYKYMQAHTQHTNVRM